MSTTPANGSGPTISVFANNTWNIGLTASNFNRPSDTLVSPSAQNPNGTYLLPSSPARRGSIDGYRPTVKKATGSIPACLVNASVTYCGNNQIYAFGGFDQYTDEGTVPVTPHVVFCANLGAYDSL